MNFKNKKESNYQTVTYRAVKSAHPFATKIRPDSKQKDTKPGQFGGKKNPGMRHWDTLESVMLLL